jgi:hypothetical protein
MAEKVMKKDIARSSAAVALVAASLFIAPTQAAADRWEGDPLEDGAGTSNVMMPGASQEHDLESTIILADSDWIRIGRNNYHSFEARVTASTFVWNIGGGCATCPGFDRVDAAGAVLTPSVSLAPGASVIRWLDLPGGPNDQFLRMAVPPLQVLGILTGYEVELVDTSYSVPRWNNNATQVTVYLVQNPGPEAVSGNVYFFGPAGNLLHTHPFTVPPRGLEVFNTAGITALANQSGSAIVAHTGAAGTIAGKAVALEPATGFSFDTPFLRNID